MKRTTEGGYQRLQVNMRGRDFVVGDLHGQSDMLDHLLRSVGFNPKQDRLFSLGDLIDRGPGSAELLRRYASEEWFYAVLGNHEAMLIDAQDDAIAEKSWRTNGTEWADGLSREQLSELSAIAKTLPVLLELPLSDGRVVGLVHAEIRPGISWPEAASAPLQIHDVRDGAAQCIAAAAVWGRTRLKALGQMAKNPTATRIDAELKHRLLGALSVVPGIDLIIAGHTIIPTRRPVSVANLLFIDTGAFMPGWRLTMVEPLTAIYWQVKRRTDGRLQILHKKGRPLPNKMQIAPAWGS